MKRTGDEKNKKQRSETKKHFASHKNSFFVCIYLNKRSAFVNITFAVISREISAVELDKVNISSFYKQKTF